KYMDESKYFFVNPKRDRVFGIKAYQSISDIPEQFDLAILCTPMQTVESLLREAKNTVPQRRLCTRAGIRRPELRTERQLRSHL
ncbi:MAG: CoA-binding protein, partial [Oscillospiraceae bacterium]